MQKLQHVRVMVRRNSQRVTSYSKEGNFRSVLQRKHISPNDFFNSVNIIHIILVTPRVTEKKCLPFNISTL